MKKQTIAKPTSKQSNTSIGACTNTKKIHPLDGTGAVGNETPRDPRDERYSFSMLGERHPYPPLHGVAHLAALVVKGDSLREVNSAVRTALSIYDCCYSWYEENDPNFASACRFFEEKNQSPAASDHFSYEDAAKAITGQSRPGRANSYFSDFIKYHLNNGATRRTKESDKKLEEWNLEKKKTGFPLDEAFDLKLAFQKYFPNRRKKSQKKG